MNVQLLVMCYNSSKLIVDCLDSWKKSVSSIVVFIDNKTTDETYNLLKGRGYKIYFFDFIDFGTSRNYCLETASKLVRGSYYQLFIDDSFFLIGNFPKHFGGRESYTFTVNTNNNEYHSTRIIRSGDKLRYVGKVHEFIDCKTTCYISKEYFYVLDKKCPEHDQRTNDRLLNDLNALDGLWDFRSLFYLVNISCSLLKCKRSYTSNEICYYAMNYLTTTQGTYFPEERFLVCLILGNILGVKWYIKASVIFPARANEAYLGAYYSTRNKNYIKLAHLHLKTGDTILPMNSNIEKTIVELYSLEGFV